MRVLPATLLVLIGAVCGAGGSPALAQGEPNPLLDPAFGNVEGREAILIAPTEASAGKSRRIPSDPFSVHMTPLFAPGRELVYPAGQWLAPPKGQYRIWLESDWKISPYSSRLVYAARPFDGDGVRAALKVVEGGRVRPSASNDSESRLYFRLLHAGSYVHNGALQQELSRQSEWDAAHRGLLMPPGTTLAGVWNEAQQRYIALSEPFEVEARKLKEAPLRRPGENAFLVVQLLRPRTAGSDDHPPLDLWLELDGQDGLIDPDHHLETAASVYGLWYDLPPGTAHLTASSGVAYLEPFTIELTRGRIERVTAELEEQTLDLPDP